MTRAHTRYSEIVADIMEDMGGGYAAKKSYVSRENARKFKTSWW